VAPAPALGQRRHFIGLFCAFLPLPFQMVIAASLAVLSRCNVPIAVVLVWVSNPITMTPMLFFSYQLGAWLLDRRIEVATIRAQLGVAVRPHRSRSAGRCCSARCCAAGWQG
jgi:uncharacterized protein (DUF2062 family)